MSAALELAGFPPEVIEAARLILSVVPAAPAPTLEDDAVRGLSMLLKSIRRRACERQQSAAARRDSIGDRIGGLSTIPASVRRRESERRRAAAKKADSIGDRAPSLDLQPVITEKITAKAGGVLRTGQIAPGKHGPLAGDVAQAIGLVSGYAESNEKRDRVWLYGKARTTWNEDLGLHLPEQWSGQKDWSAAKVLLRHCDRELLLKALLSTGREWKARPGKWDRPTLGLVLFHLRRDGLVPPAAKSTRAKPAKPDPRRLTGEQLEQRDQERARAAAASAPMKPAATSSSPAPTKPAAPSSSPAPTKPPAAPTSPASPIGPRDLRGVRREEVKGKVAEIFEHIEKRRGGVP